MCVFSESVFLCFDEVEGSPQSVESESGNDLFLLVSDPPWEAVDPFLLPLDPPWEDVDPFWLVSRGPPCMGGTRPILDISGAATGDGNPFLDDRGLIRFAAGVNIIPIPVVVVRVTQWVSFIPAQPLEHPITCLV